MIVQDRLHIELLGVMWTVHPYAELQDDGLNGSIHIAGMVAPVGAIVGEALYRQSILLKDTGGVLYHILMNQHRLQFL